MRCRQILGGLAAVGAVFSLAGCSLAQPERVGPDQDRFVGYHLVYEPISGEGEVVFVEDENWVEYGSETLDLGAYGSAEIPQKILIGERQDNGNYIFSGKEGLNFFFPIYKAGYGENEHEVRLSCSQLEMTRQSSQTDDAGNSYHYSGVACYGLPQGVTEWPEGQAAEYGWTAYDVFQREDGTVYLTGDGNRYAGAGGDFGFGQEWIQAEKFNGETYQESSLEFQVDFQVIPRVESVTLQQYNDGHRLLTEHTLPAQEALSLEDGWIVPMAEGAAYTLMVKNNADGTTDYELFPDPLNEGLPRETILWFLDARGMGVPVTTVLEADT